MFPSSQKSPIGAPSPYPAYVLLKGITESGSDAAAIIIPNIPTGPYKDYGVGPVLRISTHCLGAYFGVP